MSRISLTLSEYPIVKKISNSRYPKKIKINQNLPFRVKFLPGIISEYNPNRPAPIGIAIIGVNNYIL